MISEMKKMKKEEKVKSTYSHVEGIQFWEYKVDLI